MADARLEVYDANGNTVFDASTLTPRKFTSFRTTTSDGSSPSYTIPDGAQAKAVVRDPGVVVDVSRHGSVWEWKYGAIPDRVRTETDVDIWLY